MPIEILPEVAYQIGGQLRLTLFFPEGVPEPTVSHFYFDQPAGAWTDEELVAVVQARWPGSVVTFRLPEVTPTPENNV